MVQEENVEVLLLTNFLRSTCEVSDPAGSVVRVPLWIPTVSQSSGTQRPDQPTKHSSILPISFHLGKYFFKKQKRERIPECTSSDRAVIICV